MNSKFKVGDVVNVAGHPDTLYVVNEALLVEDETTVHLYDVSPIYDTNQDSLTCEGALLTFQYHDKQWEEYFTEGTNRGNGLVEWSGKLYNFYMFYDKPDRHGKLDKNLMKEYWNHTIPPEFMEHILKSHSVWDRMDVVLNTSNNKQKLMTTFNLDDNQLQDIKDNIRDKITANNMNDLKSSDHRKCHDFTKEELAFIDQTMMLDDEKDHYLVTMTYLDIMRAIKQAYETANKTNDRIKMQKSLDKRTGELKQPVKGQRLYRGESERYSLTIEFWYDLDLEVVTTAYPVVVNNNAKKH